MTTADDLVHRHVRAFNSGDAEALLADFTPDAIWTTGDYTVPSGELGIFFEGAMRSLRPQLTVGRVIDGGGVVVAEMTETWTHENERSMFSSSTRWRGSAAVSGLNLASRSLSSASETTSPAASDRLATSSSSARRSAPS